MVRNREKNSRLPDQTWRFWQELEVCNTWVRGAVTPRPTFSRARPTDRIELRIEQSSPEAHIWNAFLVTKAALLSVGCLDCITLIRARRSFSLSSIETTKVGLATRSQSFSTCPVEHQHQAFCLFLHTREEECIHEEAEPSAGLSPVANSRRVTIPRVSAGTHWTQQQISGMCSVEFESVRRVSPG